MKKLITITTDFADHLAGAQLKAVLIKEGYTGNLIENHQVPPYSITHGAFALELITRYCPLNSIHVGVIDPGVGSARRGIIVRSKRYWFVGPDNGLLYPAAKTNDIISVWKLNEEFFGKNVSYTFHGRDVFIKAAAYLSLDKHPQEFDSTALDLHRIKRLDYRSGQVLHIDPYGNIKLFWPKKIIPGTKLLIQNGSHRHRIPVVNTFSDVAKGQALALLGSSNTLELAVNQGNARKHFNIDTRSILDIRYK